tara:strand:+ start:9117 stop:9764 length:648 start_codon:yes stop_codon:yes gene_type:complete
MGISKYLQAQILKETSRVGYDRATDNHLKDKPMKKSGLRLAVLTAIKEKQGLTSWLTAHWLHEIINGMDAPVTSSIGSCLSESEKAGVLISLRGDGGIRGYRIADDYKVARVTTLYNVVGNYVKRRGIRRKVEAVNKAKIAAACAPVTKPDEIQLDLPGVEPPKPAPTERVETFSVDVICKSGTMYKIALEDTADVHTSMKRFMSSLEKLVSTNV